MKKNMTLVFAVLAALCFIAVFYMLLTGAAPATTALPFAIVGVICALLAGRDTRPDTSTAAYRTKDV